MDLNVSQISKSEPKAPPPTNRGVQNTGLAMAGVTIDWISATFPDDFRIRQNLRGTFLPESERDKGIYGYDRAATVLTYGTMLWSSTRPEMGIHLILPSQALALWKGGPFVLLSVILNNSGELTRLDLAFDDFSGLLSLETMAAKLELGFVQTRFKSWKPHYTSEEIGNGKPEFSGLSIGSRQSESYVRIYDKKLERQKKGIPTEVSSWIRVELETKGERATPLGKMLMDLKDNQERSQRAAGLLLGLLDFKEIDLTDSNKSRWKTSEWWLEFLDNASKEYLTLPKTLQNLETVKDWFSHCVAPLAYVILIALHKDGENGYDWLMDAIQAGEERLKARHKKILAGGDG